MQPEKVVCHDGTSRERRLGILFASRDRSCHSGCDCRGKKLQSRISMPRSFVNLLPQRSVPSCVAAGRDKCKKAYSAPCPADWFAFNGGMSCSAPSHYAGACLPVQLRGIFRKMHEYHNLFGEGFAWSPGYLCGREDKPGKEMSISLAMRWLDSCFWRVCCLFLDVLVFLCRGSVCINSAKYWWRCRP